MKIVIENKISAVLQIGQYFTVMGAMMRRGNLCRYWDGFTFARFMQFRNCNLNFK